MAMTPEERKTLNEKNKAARDAIALQKKAEKEKASMVPATQYNNAKAEIMQKDAEIKRLEKNVSWLTEQLEFRNTKLNEKQIELEKVSHTLDAFKEIIKGKIY